eukprot:CAMPEP_0118926762 /NCGR_PEP_ID=MMETSP1169-20130426/4380_1 /TAXON_ID=36882 /ORGANISM="Pyramimonas obovata, Strain CCMP722" /LENGTH=129 /DNA_ID=CAMNT_0006868383 /DNA_START=315 /DNA_END=702 /DNA_ORIENTATION=-
MGKGVVDDYCVALSTCMYHAKVVTADHTEGIAALSEIQPRRQDNAIAKDLDANEAQAYLGDALSNALSHSTGELGELTTTAASSPALPGALEVASIQSSDSSSCNAGATLYTLLLVFITLSWFWLILPW